MEKYILYTTDCPKCKQLVKKLKENGISYSVENNFQIMHDMGISTVPRFYNGQDLLTFQQAWQ